VCNILVGDVRASVDEGAYACGTNQRLQRARTCAVTDVLAGSVRSRFRIWLCCQDEFDCAVAHLLR